MYLYNVTIITEDDIREIVRQHIEEHLKHYREATASVALLELLDSPHEGTTYCLQLRAAHNEEIALFQQQYLAPIQAFANQQHTGKVLFFDSVMKYLSSY
ncbi:protein of unknown function [Parapedobacter luteus]|uniref:DUF4286 domain-containing protein n=1 Tax=Parapedobacter luteus TaxID=623280 RepID=A0A1T5AH92_9SPHI|nr:DUF4286 family protein [Parapedobacter luteus]SKB34371.1 protein of unknown function [Parapedobacter luteus]